jgi:hypothetical protein
MRQQGFMVVLQDRGGPVKDTWVRDAVSSMLVQGEVEVIETLPLQELRDSVLDLIRRFEKSIGSCPPELHGEAYHDLRERIELLFDPYEEEEVADA